MDIWGNVNLGNTYPFNHLLLLLQQGVLLPGCVSVLLLHLTHAPPQVLVTGARAPAARVPGLRGGPLGGGGSGCALLGARQTPVLLLEARHGGDQLGRLRAPLLFDYLQLLSKWSGLITNKM